MKPDYTEMFASGEGAILAGVFLTVAGVLSPLLAYFSTCYRRGACIPSRVGGESGSPGWRGFP